MDKVQGKAQEMSEYVRRNIVPVILALVGVIVLVLALATMKGKKIFASAGAR